MSTLTNERNPAAPLARPPAPVFVDGSGVRRAWAVRVLVGVAAVCLGYLLVLGVGLLGGATPEGLLPWPTGRASTDPGKVTRPAQPVVSPPARTGPGAAPVPGPRRPGPVAPKVPAPAVPAPAVPAPAAPPGTSAPSPTASPGPASTVAAPAATHGRSAQAPGHLKRTSPPPSSTKKPAPGHPVHTG